MFKAIVKQRLALNFWQNQIFRKNKRIRMISSLRSLIKCRKAILFSKFLFIGFYLEFFMQISMF